MKNDYKIQGETTIVYCAYQHTLVPFVIDTVDLPLINKVGSWNVLKKPNGTMYIQGRVNGKRITLQRYLLDAPLGSIVDHKNRNTLDYTRNNLQITDQTTNMRNRNPSRTSKTGYIGITIENNKYRASIRVNGRLMRLGYYSSLQDAIDARHQAEIEYWGSKNSL
jgi:hypothetical protein